MVVNDNQSLSIEIQNFRKKFDKDVLKSEPRIDIDEIKRLDEIIKRTSIIEKRIEKLESEVDRQFITNGNYFFKFILIFGCSWFFIGNILSIHWFGLLGISLFLSIFSFWFLIASERKEKKNIDKSSTGENHSLKNEMNYWIIQKREAEQKYKINELNQEFIDICLRDLLYWQQHENERIVFNELLDREKSLKKESV
jgi:hypothetical protein